MNKEEQLSLKANFKIAFTEIRLAVLEQYLNHLSNDEYYLLSIAELLPINKQKKLLGSIFENSKWFGTNMKEELNNNCKIEDIKEILPLTGIPCILGFWKPGKNNEIFTLKHNTCNYSPNLLKCGYWYNAINGMISGLSTDISFARHDSIGNQDQTCTNIIFNSKYKEQHWKDVPAYINLKFNYLTEHLKAFGINIKLKGYADGTIFYQIEGNNNKFLIETVLKLLSLREPNFNFVDIKDLEKNSKKANIHL